MEHTDFPAAVISVYAESEGQRHYLGTADVTWSLLNICRDDPEERRRIYAGGMPQVNQVLQDLPASVHRHLLIGRLILPDFTEVARSFFEQIEGQEDDFAQRLRTIDTLEIKSTQARELLNKVDSLKWGEASGCVCDLDGNIHESLEALKARAIEEQRAVYTASHRLPAYGDADNYVQWKEEMERSLGDSVPPFAYATRAISWEGIRADDVYDVYDDLGYIGREDIHNLLDAALSDFPDVSYEMLPEEEVDALCDMLTSWQEEQKDGFCDGFNLERKLHDWNHRQNLCTHIPDYTTVIPLEEGSGPEEARQWCEQQIKSYQERISEIKRAFLQSNHLPTQQDAAGLRMGSL